MLNNVKTDHIKCDKRRFFRKLMPMSEQFRGRIRVGHVPTLCLEVVPSDSLRKGKGTSIKEFSIFVRFIQVTI
jgi:hypothetical protein